jgi:hypothetical protein
MRLPARTLASGLYLDELVAGAPERYLGVLMDERGGTAAAVLRAKGGPFCLLDGDEKLRKLACWGAVLESLASHRSNLARLQWCQRSLPGDSQSLVRHLRLVGDQRSPAYGGQLGLAAAAGPRSWQHETLLVVVVRWQGRFGRAAKEGGELLRNEVRALRAQLRSAGLVCEPALDAQAVAAAVGRFLGPGLRDHPRAYQWPLAVEERWGELRIDGSWHRTYWVAEWPRSNVGPDFLSPLLLGPGRRAFSVVMSPVPPERAARDTESSRTAQLADSHLRAQGGFLETAQHRRRAEALEGRETQLADGRGAFEFAGYVTVSAAELTGLEESCAELERSAGAARLCLRNLYGQQREALTWAMPFGRGL